MLSIIVPAFREPFLGKTVESLLANAKGEIEVIPVFDGWQPDTPLPQDSRLKPIILTENKGKRGAVNSAFTHAKGKLVMVIDAHCIIAPGFDTVLNQRWPENWLMVPRKYSLNPKIWQRDDSRPIVDYYYLSFPAESQWGFGMYARQWDVPTRDRAENPELVIDDAMTIQASCWIVNREYFLKHLFPMDEKNYGSLAQDQQELALKYWLGGGEVKVNKKTWYAHVAKRWYHYSQHLFSRRHKKDQQYREGNTWGTWHWLNNEEPRMVHPFSWLIEKFSPVPEWPDNWQKDLNKLRGKYAF